MKPGYRPEENYKQHAPKSNSRPEKPPESTPEQRLSPSGTARGFNSKGAQKAKERALKVIEDMWK